MDKIINPVNGEEIIFHTTSRRSNGAKSLAEVYYPNDGGAPLHYHNAFAETFTVLEGELKVQVGKTIHTLHPGETVTAHPGDRHRFFNASGKPIKFMVELSPGAEGFENVLRIGFGLARDGKATKGGVIPKKLRHMAIMMALGDGSFVGLFSLFAGVLKMIGNTQKSKKELQELLKKYGEQRIN